MGQARAEFRLPPLGGFLMRDAMASESARQTSLSQYAILDTVAEQAFDDITKIAAHVAQTPIALISLVDRDRQWFKSRIGIEIDETPKHMSFCVHAIKDPSSLLIVPDAQMDERFADNPLVVGDPGIRFYCGAPLLTPDHRAVGTLCVIDRVPRQLSVEQTGMLEALSRQVMALMEMRRFTETLLRTTESQRALVSQLESARAELTHAYGRLRIECLTDKLTGVGNRSAFDERFQQEIETAKRIQKPLSLLLVDIDHFKPLNDLHGHEAGDATLRTIARALHCVGPDDFLARYGGDEFVVILPSTGKRDARLVAERILTAVAEQDFPFGPVSVSIGAATRLSEAVDPASLFNEADKALYAAKRRGRDRVEHALDLVHQDEPDSAARLRASAETRGVKSTSAPSFIQFGQVVHDNPKRRRP